MSDHNLDRMESDIGGAAEVCDECGRPSNQLSEDSEKFLLCPACTVAQPPAPEAAAVLPIKRYWPGAVDDIDGLRAVMDEHPDGDWVRYADISAPIAPAAEELIFKAGFKAGSKYNYVYLNDEQIELLTNAEWDKFVKEKK